LRNLLGLNTFQHGRPRHQQEALWQNRPETLQFERFHSAFGNEAGVRLYQEQKGNREVVMALNININANDAVPQDEMYEKYSVDRPGKITFIGHHLSAKNTMRCLIRNISLYGADIEVSPHLDLPSNFYLEVLGIRDEIGCTLIRREVEQATVGFNMLIDAEFLHHIRRLSFETAV